MTDDLIERCERLLCVLDPESRPVQIDRADLRALIDRARVPPPIVPPVSPRAAYVLEHARYPFDAFDV